MKIRNLKNDTDDIELFDHHKPRHIDKKKHHRRGFCEDIDIQQKRNSRINFKKYIQDMKAASLTDDMDE